MKVSRAFLEALVDMSQCASKDETRITLNYCRISKKGESLQLAVTDGHRLAFRTIGAEEIDPIDGELLLDASKGAVKIYKAKIGMAGKYSFGPVIDVSEHIGKDVTFPNVEAVDPNPEQYQDFSIGLNPEYLLGMLEAMRQEKRTLGVKLRFKAKKEMGEDGAVSVGLDPMAPIIVEVGETHGVLMPMRL